MDDEDLFNTYHVPGLGEVMNDGTYWTFINSAEKLLIEEAGMKSCNGQPCLGIRAIGDKLIAKWRSGFRVTP